LADWRKQLELVAGINASGMESGSTASVSALNRVKSAAVAVGGAIGVAFGSAQILRMVKDMSKAAAEEELAFKRLANSVTLAGGSWDKSGESLRQMFTDMQKVTMFSDDRMASALNQMMLVTQDYDMATRALPTALKLAESGLMGLESAVMLTGKAYAGNIIQLQRWFPSLRDAADPVAELERQIAKLGSTVGTTAQAQARLTNAIGDFGESVGQQLNENIRPFIVELSRMIEKINELRALQGGSGGGGVTVGSGLSSLMGITPFAVTRDILTARQALEEKRRRDSELAIAGMGPPVSAAFGPLDIGPPIDAITKAMVENLRAQLGTPEGWLGRTGVGIGVTRVPLTGVMPGPTREQISGRFRGMSNAEMWRSGDWQRQQSESLGIWGDKGAGKKALDDQEKAIRQSMANAISGAIITGFDQGGKVAVTQFVKMLRNKMIENLMSSLMQGLGGVFGGGPLGFLFGSAKA